MRKILAGSLFVSLVFSGGLSKTEKRIQEYVEKHSEEAIDLIEKVVNINSGTLNIDGNRTVGNIFQAELDQLGFNTYWVTYPENIKRSGHLFAEMRGGKGKRIVLIGHLDTVFEPDHPFQRFIRDGDTAYGPGVADMKAGDVSMIYVMKALDKAGVLKSLELTLVFTGDEEKTGGPPSVVRKELIEAGKWANIGLGFEGAHGMNTGTVARRSSSSWRLTTTGIQGHSSQIFKDELGYGAIFEAARIVNAFREELLGEEYLSFNPGTIVGGTDIAYDPVTARYDFRKNKCRIPSRNSSWWYPDNINRTIGQGHGKHERYRFSKFAWYDRKDKVQDQLSANGANKGELCTIG